MLEQDKLPPDGVQQAAPIAIMDRQLLDGASATFANGGTTLPPALLDEPTAHQGVSSAPSPSEEVAL